MKKNKYSLLDSSPVFRCYIGILRGCKTVPSLINYLNLPQSNISECIKVLKNNNVIDWTRGSRTKEGKVKTTKKQFIAFAGKEFLKRFGPLKKGEYSEKDIENCILFSLHLKNQILWYESKNFNDYFDKVVGIVYLNMQHDSFFTFSFD